MQNETPTTQFMQLDALVVKKLNKNSLQRTIGFFFPIFKTIFNYWQKYEKFSL